MRRDSAITPVCIIYRGKQVSLAARSAAVALGRRVIHPTVPRYQPPSAYKLLVYSFGSSAPRERRRRPRSSIRRGSSRCTCFALFALGSTLARARRCVRISLVNPPGGRGWAGWGVGDGGAPFGLSTLGIRSLRGIISAESDANSARDSVRRCAGEKRVY